MTKWNSFKIGGENGLFEIYTGRDIIIGDTEDGDIPLVSHQHENNGIVKYIKKLNNRKVFNYKETIALADRGVFYATLQRDDFHIGTRVKALTFKSGEQSENVRLFFVVAINKLQTLFKEYLINATDKLPELEIMLPVKRGKIDYSYMENYITQLKSEYINELAEYIEDNGYENCDLTNSEQNIINKFTTGNVKYALFRVGDLFDIHPTRAYKCTNRKLYSAEGKSVVVSNSSENNGRTGFSKFEPTEKNIMTFSDTTSGMSTLFYQEGSFIGYSHIQGLYPYSKKWSKESCLYFISVLKKHDNGFDYATKMNRDIVTNFEVSLPVIKGAENKKNFDVDDIDFKFMEKYIYVQEKQIIKDLVNWKNKALQNEKIEPQKP